MIKKPPLSGKAEEEFFRSESFFKRHAASLGFFSEEELDAYRVYSVDALFSLVQSGDIKAITVLAERFVQQGDYEKAKVLYMDAAIRGSVGAIHQIIVADVSIGQGISESENREVLFQLFDEQEAWRLVLKKRGFLHPLWDDSPLNPLPWAFERRSNIDSNAIVSRAEEIYQFMTAKRHELGLGNFDNQIVEEFVGHWSRLEILADEYELPTEFQMEEAEQEQAVDH